MTRQAPLDPSADYDAQEGRVVAGALFLLTFVTSIPAFLLYDPVLNDPGYILGSGADTRVLAGAFLELC